ncbi:hypothetical protein RP726_18365 [Candidatus Methylospira mobilis]|uniref:hypothetical protein n=1 Tax=Candidatus Methylospira mobilis TaxID=1808979 RepID=UPI0028EEE549|nr:hypothetical protein [Candidatus Methylospira mobilis]WNV04345.1 hypothetical protein RP726_18365 [Candidatus Methylospira mobilis]
MSQTNFFARYFRNIDMKDSDGEKPSIAAASPQQLAGGTASRRQCAILTCKCMENVQVDLAKHIGFSEKESHVVYTHGGQATQDAIRALIDSSKWLGTREWYVVHHMDCNEKFCNERFSPNEFAGNSKDHNCSDMGLSSRSNNELLPAAESRSLKQTLAKHTRRIRHHPFVPRDIPVHGCLYDGKSDNLLHVSTNLRQPLHLTVE